MRTSLVPTGNQTAHGRVGGPGVYARSAAALDVQADLPSYRPRTPRVSGLTMAPAAPERSREQPVAQLAERHKAWLRLGVGVVVQLVALVLVFGS